MAEPGPEAANHDWDEIQRIFWEARQRSPGERPGYLDKACRGDAARRAFIEALLHHDELAPPAWPLREDDPELNSSEPPRHAAGAMWSAPPSRRITPGSRVGGYKIECLIAAGAMGEVHQALQDEPPRIVALKIMKPGFDVERFEGEWNTLGRFRHPGIAQIHSAGIHDGEDGPVPFFAMEYVPNARSITRHADEWDLTVPERLELFVKVCAAVQAAHQRGIIHRDLKPSNILVDTDGQPKVIDFGVAWAADRVATERLGEVCGTWAYMSPEQLAGDPFDLDPRSDVYALGVVLYELLCRQLPYDDVSYEDVRKAQPRRPSAVNPELDGRIDAIILRALEKRRDRRYRNAADLGDELRCYLSGAPAVVSGASDPPPPPTVVPRVVTALLSVVALALGILIPSSSGYERPPPLPTADVRISAGWGHYHYGEWESLDGRPPRAGPNHLIVLTVSTDDTGLLYVFHVHPDGTDPAWRRGFGADQDCVGVEWPPQDREPVWARYPTSGGHAAMHAYVAILAQTPLDHQCEQLQAALAWQKIFEPAEEAGWPDDDASGNIRSSVSRLIDQEVTAVLGFDVFAFPAGGD